MKFCLECGTKRIGKAKFCGECGFAFKSVEEELKEKEWIKLFVERVMFLQFEFYFNVEHLIKELEAFKEKQSNYEVQVEIQNEIELLQDELNKLQMDFDKKERMNVWKNIWLLRIKEVSIQLNILYFKVSISKG